MKNLPFKLLFIAVVGLVGCKSKQKVIMENETEKVVFDEKTFDPYFKGLGTEPFWNIELSNEFIVYKDMEGNTEIFPVNRIYKAQDANVQRIISENNHHQITLTIAQQLCSDGMSDQEYDFKTEIEVSGKKVQMSQNGCGTFIIPKKLQEKWELTEFKGKQITENKYLKTPYIEFASDEKLMSGNASCNGIKSSVFIQNETLRFSKIASTRMMCVHENMETEFLAELPKITKYKIVNNELQLFSDDVLKMKLRKM